MLKEIPQQCMNMVICFLKLSFLKNLHPIIDLMTNFFVSAYKHLPDLHFLISSVTHYKSRDVLRLKLDVSGKACLS